VASWDVKAIGRAAAEGVLRRLDATSDAAPVRVMFESELVLRASCAAPAAGPRSRAR